jgi:hypothetical protein
MITKRVSLVIIGALVLLSIILSGIGWYVPRDREITAQNKIVEQYVWHYLDFSNKRRLIQEGLWTADNAEKKIPMLTQNLEK